MSKKMSRRSFLKMTAAGAVGAAGMGVFAPLSAIAEEKQTAADESGIQGNLKADIVAALMDDVFTQMTATADMPAASLAQIDSLFSMMLDTLERCAFFFLDNELKQENDPLHLAHHTHLRARLIDGKPIAPCGRRKIEVS